MKESVERYGYRVVEAKNEAEAFQVLERESPEIILTEEEMPAFSALLARLRDHPAFRSIPVVIVNPDADESVRYGDAYLLTSYARIASLLLSLGR